MSQRPFGSQKPRFQPVYRKLAVRDKNKYNPRDEARKHIRQAGTSAFFAAAIPAKPFSWLK